MSTRTDHILFTEDDEDSREMLAVYLRNAGYVVTCTQNPAEAIRFAREHFYNLILVDNWMPEMSGAELTREIRKFDHTTPILFYSGAAYESDKKDAKDSGAQGYLVKPDGISELVSEVARLIADSEIAVPLLVELAGGDYHAKDSQCDDSENRQDSEYPKSKSQRYGSG